MEAFEAAAVGSYIHGRAGDRVSGEKGTYACMAWDIAEAAGR
jgi:NAD(P)H-hydrate repair Nnr-like enzyme with NAD(P)H-hydrate dehydratase domain